MRYILSLSAVIIVLQIFAWSAGGIIVFTQKGCSRCEFTINYLKKNGISFIEYPTEDETNNSKMWSMIEQSGGKDIEHITMPVIIKNGTANFSIVDLEVFLERITEN